MSQGQHTVEQTPVEQPPVEQTPVEQPLPNDYGYTALNDLFFGKESAPGLIKESGELDLRFYLERCVF